MASLIFVERLLEHYQVYAPLGITRAGYLKKSWEPMDEYVRDQDRYKQTSAWHYGRIEHFVRTLRAGNRLDAIEVDMQWCGSACTGLVVVDGHHRLIAADITGTERIKASVSGIVTIIDWLRGRNNIKPEF